MSSVLFARVNGIEADSISISDRGLAYGDGLFETMRVSAGHIPLLDFHLARLARGCEVLGFAANTTQLERLCSRFREEVSACLAYLSRAQTDVSIGSDLSTVSESNNLKQGSIIKIMLTRGTGGRGYEPSSTPEFSFVSQVFKLPDYAALQTQGARVALATYSMGLNPALAGVKHLNRLDQVMLATELKQLRPSTDKASEVSHTDELLACDLEGFLIEGTKTNVLLFNDEQVLTPKLDRCGISGTLRDYLLEQAEALPFNISEARVHRDELAHFKAMAVINSVMGVVPVSHIDGRNLELDPRCETLSAFLQSSLSYSHRVCDDSSFQQRLL